MGNAFKTSNFSIVGIPSIKLINPKYGSLYGGTLLTITGNGFDSIQDTQVLIGSKNCTLLSVSSTQITCVTASQGIGNYTVNIASNRVTFPSNFFSYNQLATPNLTSITPTSGSSDQLISINGFGFGNSTSK